MVPRWSGCTGTNPAPRTPLLSWCCPTSTRRTTGRSLPPCSDPSHLGRVQHPAPDHRHCRRRPSRRRGGDQLFDDSGAVVGTHGFYVDVSPSITQAREEAVTEAVAEIAEARGVIEQAKGMLMLIYRINEDAAFELLKWRSQETNTKLRLLAEQLAEDFLALDYSETLPSRAILTGSCSPPTCGSAPRFSQARSREDSRR